MTLSGKNYIAGRFSGQGSETFRAEDPNQAQALPVDFYVATQAEIGEAIEKAESAFELYRRMDAGRIAGFLETIADEILESGDALVRRCMAETALPEGRILGERARTVNQLKLFAEVVREGSWVDARIDHALPQREPVPKPDVRSMLQPLGPVGIFGASNFPLAFSVAGGDTASALASGCPVVVKAHPSHPGTCEWVARAIDSAIRKCSMPEGVFSMVQGNNHEVGLAIVKHPLIQAIGFTGSFAGGKAIFDAANQRPGPIPVYAEMGSTNPVFILPGALAERGKEIALGLTQSATLGVGQFCTNPGLVFLPEPKVAAPFLEDLAQEFEKIEGQAMLNQGIQSAFQQGVKQLEVYGLRRIAEGKQGSGDSYSASAQVFSSSVSTFLDHEALEEEVFGPSTIAFTSDRKEELLESARRLKGHLTASLFGTPEDLVEYRDLLRILERKVGRLLINQFPTGVEVCDAMVHGGPFPATTDSRTTSVGTASILRFARPVCYQNFPESLLPDELKEANPRRIWRLVDGEWTR